LPRSRNRCVCWHVTVDDPSLETHADVHVALTIKDKSFNHLAQNEDWLADQYDKMIHSQERALVGKGFDRKAIAESEEHILRCLGAAVIMQWNTIPAKLQRELFDTAGSFGDLPQTVTLRGQIARFLHNHKDEEKPVDCIPKPNDERKA